MRRRDFLCAAPAAALAASLPSIPSGVRLGHVMAFDTVRNELLVIGGVNPQDASGLEPLWIRRRDEWRRGADGPPTRLLAGAAFDRARKVMLMYGGVGPNNTHYADAWTWNGKSWTKLPEQSDSPGPRDHHAMAYDAARRKVVLYGGGGAGGSKWHEDTWEWDGRAWKQFDVPGPGGRAHHAMAYDPRRARVVLTGGFGAGPTNDSTWEWDGAAWKEFPNSGLSTRSHHRMAYHESAGVMVLYGGDIRNRRPSPVAETWVREGEKWTQRNAADPGPRSMHAIAYDSSRKQVMLYGGVRGATLDELWSFDGERWKRN